MFIAVLHVLILIYMFMCVCVCMCIDIVIKSAIVIPVQCDRGSIHPAQQ